MTKSSEFCRALTNRARECSVAEFKELLIKFGEETENLDAFQKAVDRLSREEDRGSYCEPASFGYDAYVKKERLLEDYRLGSGAFKTTFNKTASSPSPDTSLHQQVAELTRRVKELEARVGMDVPKVKINLKG